MKHHMISFKTFAPLAATAVLAAALSGAPAYAAQDKSDTSMQAAAGETAEDFTNWAEKKADALDKQLDEVAAEAKEAGADAQAEVKEQWQDAQDAIDRQRDAVAKQIGDLKKAAKSEWSDVKEATEDGLDTLGKKIEEFRVMIQDWQKSDKKASVDPRPGFAATASAGLSDQDEKDLRDRAREQAGLKTILPTTIAR